MTVSEIAIFLEFYKKNFNNIDFVQTIYLLVRKRNLKVAFSKPHMIK